MCEVGLQLCTHTQGMPARLSDPFKGKTVAGRMVLKRVACPTARATSHPTSGIARKYAFEVTTKDGIEGITRGGDQRKLLVISSRETAVHTRTWHRERF